jgi:signal transduction histidine kinase/CheY-like chemotaxis protein
LRLSNLKTVIAVFLLLALQLIFFIDHREQELLRQRSLENTAETNWRLSEVIFEAQNVVKIIDDIIYQNQVGKKEEGEKYETALLRYEILWSNVDIALSTDLRFFPEFKKPMDELKSYLQSVEEAMYSSVPLQSDFLSIVQDNINFHAMALHGEWQKTYISRAFPKRDYERMVKSREAMRERIVLGLICLLTIYLIIEAKFLSQARDKEHTLRAQAQAASLANKTKTQFLANVSHEIRTPLNAIIGVTNELLETPVTKDQRDCLKVVSHSGNSLLRTINDLLDLSKIETGKIDFEFNEFNIRDSLRTCIGLYAPLAREKSNSLKLQCDDNLPYVLFGDETRINQVLHNLIGNAIKFTEMGCIEVNVRRAERDGFVIFEVRDSGEGINPELHERIFEPFSQADSSISRSKGGTGLGLTISKNLCQSMGGDLYVKSERFEGSVFWFELPLLEGVKGEKNDLGLIGQVGNEVDLSECEIHHISGSLLIADDNKSNIFLLKRYLRKTQLHIDEVGNGLAAVKAAIKNEYDVILMDVQMPIMDGIVATNLIRKNESKNMKKRARIIAVTANVMSHQISNYIENGADDVVSKPVSKSELLERLCQRDGS